LPVWEMETVSGSSGGVESSFLSLSFTEVEGVF